MNCIVPDITHCPICAKSLTTKKLKTVILHTTTGATITQLKILRCQHQLQNSTTKCGTTVSLNKYTHNGKQVFFSQHQPKFILIGESHIFDIQYARRVAIQQLLHGNGVTLITMQAKITDQNINTPNIDTKINGTKITTPSVSPDIIQALLKLWMLLRYLGTHNPAPTNSFPQKWTVEQIITSLGNQLLTFNLRPHAASSSYSCTTNSFILDGTCKVRFRVCGVFGCMSGIVDPTKNTCSEHSYQVESVKSYTGN